MCMIDDGDRAQLWSESTRRARKEHKCCECGRTIHIGEKYCVVFGKQDGDTFFDKWCGHCDVAKDWLWTNCSGSILTCVIEDIRSHVEDYRGQAACVPRLQRIVVGAGRFWKIGRGARKGQLMALPKLPANLEPKHVN